MKILHIDDSHEITETFSDVFALQNNDYSCIHEGRKAIEVICNENFDVILLDLGLPDLSGYDVLNELQKRGKDTKNIIVMTGYSIEDEEKETLEKCGIDTILVKPIQINRLLAEVQKKHSEVLA